jgi:Rrf2 family protein
MLSKSGTHAVRALVVLAELPKGTNAGAASIAERIQAPRNYLGKILQQLSREGLVISQKGLGGGFRLACEPKDISLLEIVDPIEQIDRWSGCILGRDACSEDNPCAIHSGWKAVKDAYMALLGDTTLADLVVQQRTEDK